MSIRLSREFTSVDSRKYPSSVFISITSFIALFKREAQTIRRVVSALHSPQLGRLAGRKSSPAHRSKRRHQHYESDIRQNTRFMILCILKRLTANPLHCYVNYVPTFESNDLDNVYSHRSCFHLTELKTIPNTMNSSLRLLRFYLFLSRPTPEFWSGKSGSGIITWLY